MSFSDQVRDRERILCAGNKMILRYVQASLRYSTLKCLENDSRDNMRDGVALEKRGVGSRPRARWGMNIGKSPKYLCRKQP